LHERAWITVAVAASRMGVGHRQALRLLARRNIEVGGRLLRKVGDKCMPRGVQASKWLVSTEVFQELMRPTPAPSERDIADLRAELVLTREKLEALRKAVRPLLRQHAEQNAT
jgi:hypothetical protein